jgi:hypothetical protein
MQTIIVEKRVGAFWTSFRPVQMWFSVKIYIQTTFLLCFIYQIVVSLRKGCEISVLSGFQYIELQMPYYIWNLWIVLEIALMRISVDDSIWLFITLAPYSFIFCFFLNWFISNVLILQQMVLSSYNDLAFLGHFRTSKFIYSFWAVLS